MKESIHNPVQEELWVNRLPGSQVTTPTSAHWWHHILWWQDFATAGCVVSEQWCSYINGPVVDETPVKDLSSRVILHIRTSESNLYISSQKVITDGIMDFTKYSQHDKQC